VLLGILRRLDRDQFEPLVCVASGGGREEEVRALDVPVLCLPHTTPALPRTTFLQRILSISRPFRDFGPDIWHSWNYSDDYSESFVARAAGSRRWIFTKKNLSWGSRAWYLRSLMASHIAVSSPLMLQRFYSGRFWKGRASVIMHGVDTHLFRPRPAAIHWLRERIKAPPDSYVVGCVANLVPIKNHGLLIRAISRLEPRPHLVLVGSGDELYQRQLRDLAVSLGMQSIVHFLGSLPRVEVARVVAGLSLFVLPSRAEGLGVALIEAMACEVACIATKCGGPEVVIEPGEDGELVEVGDESALVGRIAVLLADHDARVRMGGAARETVLRRFSVQAEVDGYSRLYRQLTSGRVSKTERKRIPGAH